MCKKIKKEPVKLPKFAGSIEQALGFNSAIQTPPEYFIGAPPWVMSMMVELTIAILPKTTTAARQGNGAQALGALVGHLQRVQKPNHELKQALRAFESFCNNNGKTHMRPLRGTNQLTAVIQENVGRALLLPLKNLSSQISRGLRRITAVSIDRLTKRGLLRPSRATRRPLYPIWEIERFLRETSTAIRLRNNQEPHCSATALGEPDRTSPRDKQPSGHWHDCKADNA